MVELALTAPDTAKIEAERGKAALLEHIEKIINDLVVHRAAELWVRMQDECDRRVLFLGRLIAAFEASGRSVENDFWHVYSARNRQIGPRQRA